jgi:endonuclease-8
VVNFSAPVIELLEERALAHHQPLAGLGPDLLDDDFDADAALRRLRAPERAALTIGDAIMDQQVMAGVGNIWKHETLFRCGLNPWWLVSQLDDDSLRAVIDWARQLLRASVGKPNTLGTRGRPTMWVYGRTGRACLRCGARLRSATQGRDIRRTTWCPRCQPALPEQARQPASRSLGG